MSAASHSIPNITQKNAGAAPFMAATLNSPFSPMSVLPAQDRIAYDRLGAMLIEELEAKTPLELNFVSEIQDTDWRIRRLGSIEKGLQTLGVQRHLENAAALTGDPSLSAAIADAIAYKEDVRIYEQIARQCARLYRLRDKLTASLDKMIAERKYDEQETRLQAKRADEAEQTRMHISVYVHNHGFVPHKSEKGAARPVVEPPPSVPADFLPQHTQREFLWMDVVRHCRALRERAA